MEYAITYTGINAAEVISEISKSGWVLEGDYPSIFDSPFRIRPVNSNGPVFTIRKGLEVSGTAGKPELVVTPVEKESDSAQRQSALIRILQRSADAGKQVRAQLVGDLNELGVDDDEISEAIRRAWVAYGGKL